MTQNKYISSEFMQRLDEKAKNETKWFRRQLNDTFLRVPLNSVCWFMRYFGNKHSKASAKVTLNVPTDLMWFFLNAKMHWYSWLTSNRASRDQTATMSRLWRRFPAEALPKPFGHGLLSPLMIVLNYVGYSEPKRLWFLVVFFSWADT